MARTTRRNRSNSPSNRWYKRWLGHYQAAGGWSGPGTLRATEGELLALYRSGATPEAAGIAVAATNRLHARLSVYAELAGEA